MVRLFNWCFQNFYECSNISTLNTNLFNKHYYNSNYKYSLLPTCKIYKQKYEYYNGPIYPAINLAPKIVECGNLIYVNKKPIYLPFDKYADDIEINKTNVVIKVNNNEVIWETVVPAI